MSCDLLLITPPSAMSLIVKVANRNSYLQTYLQVIGVAHITEEGWLSLLTH